MIRIGFSGAHYTIIIINKEPPIFLGNYSGPYITAIIRSEKGDDGVVTRFLSI